jgi:ABC-type spermidine/putrescine transport system permease subunit II
MDEYNTGMDPEVKRYFRKIINSFSIGLMWMLSVATTGLFYGLGISRNGIKWYNILFYLLSLITLAGLIYYLYKVWNKKEIE